MSGVAASLPEMLGRLKLTAMRDRLDGLLDEAARRELTLRETLALLCEREIARKDERRIEMALSIARFPFVRDLAGFDFRAQPSVDPKQLRELATGRFIANGEAVLLLGPPGVGKTHLAISLAISAAQQGRRVYYGTLAALITSLEEAQAAGIPFPAAAQARDLYAGAMGRGHAEDDFAAVLETVEGLAGVRL